MINLNYLIKIQALKKFNAQLTLIKFCNKKYINILKCSAVIEKNGIGKKLKEMEELLLEPGKLEMPMV